MKCFLHFYSQPHRKSDHKPRFSWPFFSQGSASSQGKTSSPSRSAPSSHPLDSSHDILPPSPDSSLSKLDRLLENPSVSRPPERAFSYTELRSVTKNFSRVNLLGEGGFGCVYKGVLKSQIPEEPDTVVAVKQLNRKGQQGHKEWLAEVRFLSLVDHPNLVKLVGYCAEDNERGIQRLLVYEYMENGSLEDHIFRRGRPVLPWTQRLLIMLGAAEGLAYLHERIDGVQVIFRDFKTSNVLLDKDFIPKLSDFGMAREGPDSGKSHVSTAVVGTLGYAAPEYIQTGHLTSKSDVWSFGVVLLEILSGRRSLDRNLPKNEQQLLDWARPYIHGNKKVEAIMDPHLEGQYSMIQAQKIASLAKRCLEKHARARPLMSTVVKCLKEIVELNAEDLQCNAPKESEIFNPVESKDSAATKRRRVIVKNVMHLKSREDAKNMWRIWTTKTIETQG